MALQSNLPIWKWFWSHTIRFPPTCSSHHKKGFKYFHKSYYFENYKQADAFYERVLKMDQNYFNDVNRQFYAPKIDCIVQTNGIKKSIHFVYQFYPIKQYELELCSITEKLLAKQNDTLKNIKEMNLRKLLTSESYLRFLHRRK